MSKLPMKVLNQLNSYHGLNGVIELNTNRNNVQENSLIIVY